MLYHRLSKAFEASDGVFKTEFGFRASGAKGWLSLHMYSYKAVKAQGYESLGYSYHAFSGLRDGVRGGISHDTSISARKGLVAVDGFKY